jgi:hypothetical protein
MLLLKNLGSFFRFVDIIVFYCMRLVIRCRN